MSTPFSDGGIVVRQLRRSFGPVEALRGVDLDAPPGRSPHWSVRTVPARPPLLLILATLLAPDSGEVRVAGADPVRDPDAVRARMGWSPDVFGLYEALTTREYLEFAAAAYRLPKPRRRTRAVELLGQAGLEPQADRPVHLLSRGQKQRLGLARAMVHEPSVLLLDEPAAGLDPRARVELRRPAPIGRRPRRDRPGQQPRPRRPRGTGRHRGDRGPRPHTRHTAGGPAPDPRRGSGPSTRTR